MNNLIKTIKYFRIGWFFLFFLSCFVLLIYFLSIFYSLEIKTKRNLNLVLENKFADPFYTKGFYITSWTASDEKKINQLIKLLKENNFNTLIIDVKDVSGEVAYSSQVFQNGQRQTEGAEPVRRGSAEGAEELRRSAEGTERQSVGSISEPKIKDIKRLIYHLHLSNIYTIARIAVLEDATLPNVRPDLALKNKNTNQPWQDFKGLTWLNPDSREVLDYYIALAEEAFNLGFNEVNFDYLRFPSDGKIENIAYQDNIEKKKTEVIKNAFIYLNQHLKDKGKISIDLFGLTLWHLDDDSDMNIGQRLIDALPYFDYICPMVYPSHYPSDFLGFKNPAEHPYEIISANLKKMELVKKERPDWALKIRPWLQAFNLGAIYNQDLLKEEIKAVEDNGGCGFLFWNARNDYSIFTPLEIK